MFLGIQGANNKNTHAHLSELRAHQLSLVYTHAHKTCMHCECHVGGCCRMIAARKLKMNTTMRIIKISFFWGATCLACLAYKLYAIRKWHFRHVCMQGCWRVPDIPCNTTGYHVRITNCFHLVYVKKAADGVENLKIDRERGKRRKIVCARESARESAWVLSERYLDHVLKPETLCVQSYVCNNAVRNHISAIIYVLPNTSV